MFFELYDEDTAWRRPPCLGEPPGVLDKFQQRTVESIVETFEGGVKRAWRGLQGSVPGQSSTVSSRGTTGKTTITTGTTTPSMTTAAGTSSPGQGSTAFRGTCRASSRFSVKTGFNSALWNRFLIFSSRPCPRTGFNSVWCCSSSGSKLCARTEFNSASSSRILFPLVSLGTGVQQRLVELIILVKALSQDRVHQRFAEIVPVSASWRASGVDGGPPVVMAAPSHVASDHGHDFASYLDD